MSDHDAALLRSLGRLDPARKKEFLRAAKDTVAQFGAARAAGLAKQREATREDFEALDEVRRDAKRLYRSLARASRLGLPGEFLREAWEYRAKTLDPPIAPESERFPDFGELLWQLAQSALWFMDDVKRPAHRPSETWSHAGIIVCALASYYHHFFGRPGVGSGSPFVKFVRALLQESGVTSPSRETIEKIVDECFPKAGK
jgi:hypothetical protein